MAYKNCKYTAIFFLCSSLFTNLCAGLAAHAQSSGELLWWVLQEEEEDPNTGELKKAPVTPEYTLQPNPFPYNPFPAQAPEPEIQQVVISDDELLQRQNLEEGKAILREIQNMLSRNEATTPNLSEISITGYLKGQKGPKVLMNNLWLGEGQDVIIRARQQNNFNQLIQRLNQITPSLAAELEDDLARLKTQQDNFKLVIQKIEPKKITLKSANQKTYVISY